MPDYSTRLDRVVRRQRLYGSLLVLEMVGVVLILLFGVVGFMNSTPFYTEPAKGSPVDQSPLSSSLQRTALRGAVELIRR